MRSVRFRKRPGPPKRHGPPETLVKTAQNAAPTPANDALSKGQAAQATTMTGAQPGQVQKNAFLAMLRQKLDAIAPKTDQELKEFKSSGKAKQLQGELKSGVQQQQTRAQADRPTGQMRD